MRSIQSQLRSPAIGRNYCCTKTAARATATTPNNPRATELTGSTCTSSRNTARGDWAGRCQIAGRVKPARHSKPVARPVIQGRMPAIGSEIGSHSRTTAISISEKAKPTNRPIAEPPTPSHRLCCKYKLRTRLAAMPQLFSSATWRV